MRGLNFFDHADIYGKGDCESLFGNVLNHNPGLRENMVIQSKAGIRPEIMYDNSKEYLIQSVDDILKRLHTEYLDVFLNHRPDALAEPEEVAEAFDELQVSGKVRQFGVSNHRIFRHPAEMQILTGTMEFSRIQDVCMAENIVLTRKEWYQIYLAYGRSNPKCENMKNGIVRFLF